MQKSQSFFCRGLDNGGSADNQFTFEETPNKSIFFIVFSRGGVIQGLIVTSFKYDFKIVLKTLSIDLLVFERLNGKLLLTFCSLFSLINIEVKYQGIQYENQSLL